jgi:hypothetical protein
MIGRGALRVCLDGYLRIGCDVEAFSKAVDEAVRLGDG